MTSQIPTLIEALALVILLHLAAGSRPGSV